MFGFSWTFGINLQPTTSMFFRNFHHFEIPESPESRRIMFIYTVYRARLFHLIRIIKNAWKYTKNIRKIYYFKVISSNLRKKSLLKLILWFSQNMIFNQKNWNHSLIFWAISNIFFLFERSQREETFHQTLFFKSNPGLSKVEFTVARTPFF